MRHSGPVGSSLVVVAALLWSPSGRAEEGVSKAPYTLEELDKMDLQQILSLSIPEVEVVSRRVEKSTEAPATVYVIDKDDIRLRGYGTLRDVLRDAPGMEVIDFYFSEMGTAVPVRGVVGNNKIILMVNGIRVNPPGGENLPIRSDISVRDAERVEIIYGPGSTLHGQDAVSAIINIVTRKPGQKSIGQAGVAYGMHQTRDAWLTLGHEFARGYALSAHVMYHDASLTDISRVYPEYWGAYRDAALLKNGVGATPTRFDFGLNALVRLETDTTQIQVWHRQSNRSTAESGIIAPNAFLPVIPYAPQSFFGDMTTSVSGRHTLAFSDKTRLESSLLYRRYEISPRSRYVFDVGQPGEWFLDDFKYGIGTGFTLEERVTADFSDRYSLTGGIALSHSDIVPKATIPGGVDRNQDIISQAGTFVYYTELGNPASRGEIPGAVKIGYQSLGAYAEFTGRFTDWFKGIVGARVDADTRIRQVPFSPRVAVIFNPHQSVTLKYVYNQAWLAPAPYFAHSTFDSGFSLNQSNPNIRSESASSHEISATYASKLINLGFSGYYNQQANLIQIGDRFLPVNIVQDLVYLDLAGTQTRVLTQAANSGRSRAIGFDLTARVNVWKLNGWTSYSFVHVRELNGGVAAAPIGVSAHNFRLGVTYAITDWLFVTPSLVLRSTPANLRPGPLDALAQTPYELNLHAVVRPVRNFDVFLDLRNASANRYALGGISGYAFPQEAIRAMVGVRYTLEK